MAREKRERTAPYLRIAAELRGQIERGELRPGEQVPSVTELGERHGVSRATARRALQLLKDEHLIETEVGWGSFVADR